MKKGTINDNGKTVSFAGTQGELPIFVDKAGLTRYTGIPARSIGSLMSKGHITFIKNPGKKGRVRFNLKKVVAEIESKFEQKAKR
jgi:hypothetical protein